MNDEERKALIEAATTAWRPEEGDGYPAHPAWEELDEAGRIEAFEITDSLRKMEAALDPDGLSTTAKAVMERIAREQDVEEVEPERGATLLSFPKRIIQSQPLAMAAIALLVIGIGVWVGQIGSESGDGLTERKRIARVEKAETEREPAGRVVEETPDLAEPDPAAAPVMARNEKALYMPTAEHRRKICRARVSVVGDSKDPEQQLALARCYLSFDPPTDPRTLKTVSGSGQESDATELGPTTFFCRVKVSVLEKMVNKYKDYESGPEEQLTLARCYDVLGKKSKAKEWLRELRKAAEQGDVRSQYVLGNAYATGKGVRQDFKRAAQWYRKAAEQGDARSQYGLGYAYANGKGVRQDFKRAAQWYRKAAEQGDAKAQNNLGFLYDTGKGVPQDFKLAAQWYRKAAEQEDAKAQYNLGVLYADGEGVPQDFKLAAQWYRKAAEQGDPSALVALEKLSEAK